MDWVERFTGMLFPLNRDDLNIEGAYILKHEYLPNSIFKYREVNENSLKNLLEDSVWLADPSNFNDPYDCAHTVDFSHIQKEESATIVSRFLEANKVSSTFTEEQREQLINSKEPYNCLVDILMSDESSEKREAIKIALNEVQSQIHADMAISNSKYISSSFKLCSFSERKDSMLMWAHYANYHQGFCIEYDLTSLPYSDYRRRFLYPTIYSDQMFDATDHILKGVDDEQFNNLHLSLAALIKAKDWEYEKEWRLVFANGIFETERAYHIGKPKMVYLGTKISKEHQEELIDICSTKEIPVCKMKAHHSEFKLVPMAIDEAEQHFFKEEA